MEDKQYLLYHLKVAFLGAPRAVSEEEQELIESFLHSFRMSGISLSDERLITYSGDAILVSLLVYERRQDYLSILNKYAKERYAQLGQVFSQISFSVEGIASTAVYAGEPGILDEDLYILYGSNSLLSPVRRGSNFDPIPLYYLPKTYDGTGFDDVLGWLSNYAAIDRLYMNDHYFDLGFDFVGDSLGNPESVLSQQGREIAGRLASILRKPVYYSLCLDPYGDHQTCPGCGANWTLPQPLHDHFKYSCARCLLLGY